MQKRAQDSSGFALIVTLILMALIVTVVVAYLANTRSDRATSSSYANRLRAKMIADSGLAAATKLLYDNTNTGNYITAMPAPTVSPSPGASPTPIRTEIYRPITDDDYLRLDNARGDALVSRSCHRPRRDLSHGRRRRPSRRQAVLRSASPLWPRPSKKKSFLPRHPGRRPETVTTSIRLSASDDRRTARRAACNVCFGITIAATRTGTVGRLAEFCR